CSSTPEGVAGGSAPRETCLCHPGDTLTPWPAALPSSILRCMARTCGAALCPTPGCSGRLRCPRRAAALLARGAGGSVAGLEARKAMYPSYPFKGRELLGLLPQQRNATVPRASAESLVCLYAGLRGNAIRHGSFRLLSSAHLCQRCFGLGQPERHV